MVRGSDEYRWQCLVCDGIHPRGERREAAACCIDRHEPDYTTAQPVNERLEVPPEWGGERVWEDSENE